MTCDNEHSSTTLRCSKVLSIKHSPRHKIPEFIQRTEDGCEVCPFVTAKEARNVFEDDPGRAIRMVSYQLDKTEEEA